MTKMLYFTMFCVIFWSPLKAVDFNSNFTNESCRVDFHFAGNYSQSNVFVEKILKEPFWGGRKSHLNQRLNLGEYCFEIRDSLNNELIYTDGFSSLFFEWQTTAESKTMFKSFEQTIQFPFPQKTVLVQIKERIDLENWQLKSEFFINPKDELIKNFKSQKVPLKKWVAEKDESKAIDIAVIAEGYSQAEIEKFFKDAENLRSHILSHQPFSKYERRINFYAVGANAKESGISKPQKDEWVKSALSSHYHTFYSPRYLTTNAVFATRDYAAEVPYDVIYILANSTQYGGGGIYNHYALTSSDGPNALYVTVHEFGHSFAGLGDEYYYEHSDVLDAMYDIHKEPWEPNITSLVNFDVKWKDMLEKDTEIPTPVNNAEKVKVGVFEGGGYLSKGMYRPAITCRMKDNKADSFCGVCQRSVENVIIFLTE